MKKNNLSYFSIKVIKKSINETCNEVIKCNEYDGLVCSANYTCVHYKKNQ